MKPRKFPVIKSKTYIKEKTFVEEYGDPFDVKMITESGTKQIQISKSVNTKTLKLFGDVMQKNVLKTRRYTPKQNAQIKSLTTYQPTPVSKFSIGAYAGLGLYEKTDEALASKSMSRTLSLPSERSKVNLKEISMVIPREVTREIVREVPRQVPREVPRQVPREIPKEIVREVPRQVPREVIRQIPKEILREITRIVPPNIPRVPTRPVKRVPPLRPPFFKGKSKISFDIGKYLVEERRRGKFRPVGRAKTLKEAMSLGEFKTKSNLGATFRIKGAKKGEGYGLDFGSFRLPKHPSKESPFTFIQRQRKTGGQGGRISSYGEKTEIQLARAMSR